MRDRHWLGITALPFLVAALLPGAMVGSSAGGDEVITFRDPEIVESSGLVVLDGRFVTTNDSGDTGRLFSVDPTTGETVAVTHWADEPEDVEALAPAGDGAVWVGDIGDNRAERADIEVAKVPVGPENADVHPQTYRLVYPDGHARDAESLLADPVTGRLYVVSKAVFGGMLYAAPARLSPTKPNRLEEVGPVLAIATDAAFFPDGRHVIVRNYSEAAVYSWPDLTEVGEFGLPAQPQGEGIAVARDGTVYASSEGLHTPVLRISLPAAIRRAMSPPPSATPTPTVTASPTPSDTATPPPGSRVGTELPEQDPGQRSFWGWALGGLIGLGILVVLARSLRPH
jgi:hypothetical protein